MPKSDDPTEAMREMASAFPEVDEGTSCTQASFKRNGKAFLYVGPQGGRYKAMFKLEASRAEAEALAEEDPEHFEVGSTSWVTARFTAERPLAKRIWSKWLRESYAASAGGKKKASKKAAAKKTARKTSKKAAAKKTAKKAATKKTAKKAATKKTAKKATKKKVAKKAPRKR